MDDAQSKDLITSKEILSVTGISRATLNNYIKMGIIPKPKTNCWHGGREEDRLFSQNCLRPY
jgi:hypothetical protein